MGWVDRGPARATFRAGDDESVAGQRQALLGHLAGVDADRLTALRLELYLPEHHGRDLFALLPAIAEGLAGRDWPVLAALTIAIDEDSYASGHAFTGDSIDSVMGRGNDGWCQVDEDVAGRLWQAMPALRHLELTGHWMLPHVSHPGLAELTLRGVETVVNGGYEYWDRPYGLRLPALHWLTIDFANDGCGAAMPSWLLEFPAGELPALRHLDLADSYPFALDHLANDTQWCTLDAMVNSEILDQLATLALPSFGFADRPTHNDQPVAEVLAAAAPDLVHLDRLRLARLDPALDEAETRRLLPQLDIEPVNPRTGDPVHRSGD